MALPPDFNWHLYLHPIYNVDLRRAGIADEEAAKRHYLTYGQQEGRRYRPYDSQDPLNIFPPGFSWTAYRACYPELAGARQGEILYHWVRTGYKLDKYLPSTAPAPSGKAIFVLSHNWGGGLTKYCSDLVEHLAPLSALTEYEMIINEPHFGTHPRISYYDNQAVMSILNGRYLDCYEEVIVHISALGHTMDLFDITDWENMVTSMRKHRHIKMYLTVHKLSLVVAQGFPPHYGTSRAE